jgi:4-hydroxyphenylpyruvate dioxygenase-like putative hemolysin
MMIVKFGHVLVDDQDKALRFYTETLGFIKKRDVPDGTSGLRFLTVESPDGVAGFELELQAADTAAARTYQQQFKADGFAYIAVSTNDIQAEYQRLKARGVTFIEELEMEDAGPVWSVKFDDTCGNLVNLLQVKPQP